jgi:hypothetical protein
MVLGVIRLCGKSSSAFHYSRSARTMQVHRRMLSAAQGPHSRGPVPLSFHIIIRMTVSFFSIGPYRFRNACSICRIGFSLTGFHPGLRFGGKYAILWSKETGGLGYEDLCIRRVLFGA